MFESFQRSWELTKASIEVMKKDKELFLFPILGGLFSVLFLLAIVFPTIIAAILKGVVPGAISNVMWFTVVFIVYFGLAFIATFFNVCVVYTTKTRFEGKNATFMDSIRFAGSRIHLIFMWSILSATVGVLLRVLDSIADRFGEFGHLVMTIFISLLGAAWSIITIFVVPVMVYEGKSPFAAVKRSVEVLKKTWGESLIRAFGLGLVQLVFLGLGVIIGFVLLFLGLALGLIPFLIMLLLVVIYFIALFIFFSVLNTIFNTALYYYAVKGKVPTGFSEATMKASFHSSKR